MLTLFDNLLRQVLLDGVPSLRPPAVVADQVRFQPPDDTWRGQVTNLQRNAFNIYLVDLRENRKLRSNERVRSIENGIVSEEPAPTRLDCHYLISAWSPAELTQQIEPTLDEHALLYEAAAVLFRTAPFNPSRVYPAGSAALNAWPERYREADLPAVVAPVDGFNKLSEFWTSMGQNARWKPAIYLIVTLPVELVRAVAGPMVTTRITEYSLTGRPETAEVLIQIGGQVLDTANPLPGGAPAPVSGAWVRLETQAGVSLQTATTNELGRFTFGGLRAGGYRLRVRAAGLGELTRNVDIPSDSGEYDLRFP